MVCQLTVYPCMVCELTVYTRLADSSSQHVLQYHNDTTQHYIETLYNLRKVNQTVTYLLNTIAALEGSLDEKLGWISTHLGGTGGFCTRMFTGSLRRGAGSHVPGLKQTTVGCGEQRAIACSSVPRSQTSDLSN